ncbi:LAMI_0C02146g1_1 [Lachancea mirantina]|uniref:LAMI_0C02146g1_1 n=1 Tax=Lachancea mirantina TaxID=1230905 RepID=A0A1G4J0M7_9SACH|nr:LAMI_0C02146g1_1 [Lachancea mirantina]
MIRAGGMWWRKLCVPARVVGVNRPVPKVGNPVSVFSQRFLSAGAIRFHGHLTKPKKGEELHVTFILKDGTQKTYEVAAGDSLLDIAQAHNLDMEGACGGSCACSTCHVIVDPDYYDALEEPDDDENDMLDLAYGLTETSRLGCQIKMSKAIDGIRVALPAMTRNVSNKDFD